MATLTYNYADSTVVLGPMSRLAEPHTYDLCARHAQSMTAPKGWDLLRIEAPEGTVAAPVDPDDLLALARAVREPAPRAESLAPPQPTVRRGTGPDAGPRPGPLIGESPARPGRPVLRLLPNVGENQKP